MLFDFEWINRSFSFGRYRRTASFFEYSRVVGARSARRCGRARLLGGRSPERCAPTCSPAPVAACFGRLRRDRDTLRRALRYCARPATSLRNGASPA